MDDVDPLEAPLFGGPITRDTTTLLEQYKLYVQLADRISERRQQANSFFFGVSAALFGVLGFVYSKNTEAVVRSIAVFIPIFGIVVCAFWCALVISYKNLNSAKFRVIHALERRLAASPYDAEWKLVGEGKDGLRYLPLTHLELWIPLIVMLAHTFVLFTLP